MLLLKQGDSKINDQSFHHDMLEKEEQIKFKANRKNNKEQIPVK